MERTNLIDGHTDLSKTIPARDKPMKELTHKDAVKLVKDELKRKIPGLDLSKIMVI